MTDGEVVGAVNALAAHPSDADSLYIGAVNGGIWHTSNARDSAPSWQVMTDALPGLSVGALAFDRSDPSGQTLVAATGRFSSLRRAGNLLVGVLRSTDGGATWSVHDHGGVFRGAHFTGVAGHGATLIAGSKNRGLFRSTDAGASWASMTGPALRAGNSFALASDPQRPDRLFCHVDGQGIFRTTNVGATWTKVSTAAMDGLLGIGVDNVCISVGNSENVYVAIAAFRRLAGLFRSGDGGGSWTALDLPTTREARGTSFGIHPGGQAEIHMSLAADPVSETIVYIGGDRQPGFNEAVPAGSARRWPNSIGASDYSGRLFRVDAARPSGRQASPITHNNTASSSAPHADSRDMAFAADGTLIEADDGGVYRRTRPQRNNGDWESMNGDLQNSEFHSVAWDSNTRTTIGGAQDTGTQQQVAAGDARWPSVTKADGGGVAVDAVSTPGLSVRYASWQFLGGLQRETYDSGGAMIRRTRLRLTVVSGSVLSPQFYTPIELNRENPVRMILGAGNGVYESFDQGDTVREIAPGIVANQAGVIAYGAAGNADALYVGARRSVFVRIARPAPLVASSAFPGTADIAGLAMDPDDDRTAFVVDQLTVWRTTDAGVTWSDITHNLAAIGAQVLRSVVHCPDLGAGSVVVGSNTGVYAAEGPSFTTWQRLGTGLPSVPVMRLQYSAPDRLVLAGTLGRGAWAVTL